MSRSPRERLADIVAAIQRIRAAEGALGRAEASGDDSDVAIAFDALMYRLLVIGEAVKAIPADLQQREPSVHWSEIARMRDVLAHHYYRVDTDVIRRTLDDPLHELEAAVHRIAHQTDARS